jgi:hypothetical protein
MFNWRRSSGASRGRRASAGAELLQFGHDQPRSLGSALTESASSITVSVIGELIARVIDYVRARSIWIVRRDIRVPLVVMARLARDLQTASRQFAPRAHFGGRTSLSGHNGHGGSGGPDPDANDPSATLRDRQLPHCEKLARSPRLRSRGA